jgi:hypothetical protein
VAAAAALVPAGPAHAHGADAPSASNYRSEVVAVTPPLAGVRVRVVEAGARLELVNERDRPVQVLGYSGEPYLEIRPDGVYENVHSPATYLNQSLAGDAEVPAVADPTAPPSWRRVSGKPVARWHDHRAAWMAGRPPPAVATDPGRTHRVAEWVVPLRDGTSIVDVSGTLDWLPPPSPWPWWSAILLGAGAVALLGLPRSPRSGRAVARVLAAGSLAAGGVALAYAAGRELDAGAAHAGEVLLGLAGRQPLAVLAGLAAVAAGVLVLRRPGRGATDPSGGGDFGLALAAGCVALFAGVTNAAAFTRSVLPVPWDPTLGRVAIAGVVAAGLGIAGAAALRLRAATRHAHPVEPETG